MIVFWFAVAAFANYGIAHSISQEEGPFRAFELFRNLFVSDNWIGRGVRCILCVSTWTGLLLALLVTTNVAEFILVWWGLRGTTHILHKYWGR